MRVPFRYRRTPTLLLPLPTLPERIILPDPGIQDVFDVRIAVDERTEDDAFRVRWNVYCKELGYEPVDRFPDQREHDGDDNRSVQVVTYHRGSGEPVGCFRLMLADPRHPDLPFHVEEVCPTIHREGIPQGKGRLGVCELSRFCVVGAFRGFDGVTQQPPYGIAPQRWAEEAHHRRGLAGLMWLTAAFMVNALGLDYILTLMEPRLRMLGKVMGLNFRPIGEPVDFRGQRVPYRIDRRSLRVLVTSPAARNLLAPFADALEESLLAHPLLCSYLSSRTTRSVRKPA